MIRAVCEAEGGSWLESVRSCWQRPSTHFSAEAHVSAPHQEPKCLLCFSSSPLSSRRTSHWLNVTRTRLEETSFRTSGLCDPGVSKLPTNLHQRVYWIFDQKHRTCIPTTLSRISMCGTLYIYVFFLTYSAQYSSLETQIIVFCFYKCLELKFTHLSSVILNFNKFTLTESKCVWTDG